MSGPAPVTEDRELAALIARSAELKCALVEFAEHPRFDREWRALIRQRSARPAAMTDDEMVDTIDHFVLEYPLRGGGTVLERYLDTKRDLDPTARELLLGWHDGVQGVFEIQECVGDGLIAENLIDELRYSLYSNMGPSVFASMNPGDFLVARILPVATIWVVSGNMLPLRAVDADIVHRVAYEQAMAFPELVFRNPDKLARGRDLQRAEHDSFIEFFGSDVMVLAGAELTDRMGAFYRFRYEQASSDVPQAALPVAYPPSLVDSTSVAVVHDEVDGLGLYGRFEEIQPLFDDPGLLDRPEHRKILRSLLEDDSVLPSFFEHLVSRQPENANELFRKMLKRQYFDWSADGGQLMRKYKPDYDTGARLPSIVPLSERLYRWARGS